MTPAIDRPSGALQLGTKVHLALGAHYTDGSDPVTVLDALYAEDRERYQALESPPDLTEFEEDHQLGRIMLRGYLEWLQETGADEDYEVVGVEQQLAVPLLDGAVTFKGKLDIRVRRRSDGRKSFRDWKTAASISDAVRNLAMDEQMLGYHLLERLVEAEGEWTEWGIYDVLRKVKRSARAKPPFYAREEAYHSDVQLRSYWKRLHGMIVDILRTRERLDAGEDPLTVCYPTPTRDCHWQCPHWVGPCLLFDDGSNVEGLLASAYVEHDPYARYDDRVVQ